MDGIQSKSVNKPVRKPKVDEVKKDISNKDINKIKGDNKQKTLKADAKKSNKEENKTIEESVRVESLKDDDKVSKIAGERFETDLVKETDIKENVKSAKDWGRASNDPRNKS